MLMKTPIERSIPMLIVDLFNNYVNFLQDHKPWYVIPFMIADVYALCIAVIEMKKTLRSRNLAKCKTELDLLIHIERYYR